MKANETPEAKLDRLIRERFRTQAALARELGVTAGAVNEIVKGRSRGKMGRYAVAKALGVSVTELWPDAEDAEDTEEEPKTSAA